MVCDTRKTDVGAVIPMVAYQLQLVWRRRILSHFRMNLCLFVPTIIARSRSSQLAFRDIMWTLCSSNVDAYASSHTHQVFLIVSYFVRSNCSISRPSSLRLCDEISFFGHVILFSFRHCYACRLGAWGCCSETLETTSQIVKFTSYVEC